MNTPGKVALLLATVAILVSLTTTLAHAQAVIDPGQPDPHPERVAYQVGLYFQSRANYERAIAEFSTAIQLQPAMAEAFAARADSYAAMQQYGLAIADYTQAIALNTGDGLVYAKRAFAFAAQGDLKDGQQDFEHVVVFGSVS